MKLSFELTEQELVEEHGKMWPLLECVRTACAKIQELENTSEKLWSDRQRYEYTAKFVRDAGFEIKTWKHVDF